MRALNLEPARAFTKVCANVNKSPGLTNVAALICGIAQAVHALAAAAGGAEGALPEGAGSLEDLLRELRIAMQGIAAK